jgi:hypothetical protein
MFIIEKDNFTGLRKINSSFYGLNSFISFEGPSDIYLRYMRDKTGISDAFDLLYLESENGQGIIAMRVCSSVAKYSGNTNWPHWEDSWPMIVDGERISLNSSSINTFETDFELKVYNIPIDVFNKICNANEIKFSLRGRNKKIEGVLLQQHQILFKSFEQYCFGDENEGKKLLESIGTVAVDKNDPNQQNANYSCYNCKTNNSTPKSLNTFNCVKCGKTNTIIKPKTLTGEEEKLHESKAVDLISNKKVNDAIIYVASNFGLTNRDSLEKIKEFAEKNGLNSEIKNFVNKKPRKNLLIGLIIFLISVFLINSRYLFENYYFVLEADGTWRNYNEHDYQLLRRLNNSYLLYFIEIFGLSMVIVNMFHLLKKK